MIYFAHRGASAYMPQNSLPAFALAREMGARCYELDVHLTQDRRLAVHHDYSLQQTTGHDICLKDVEFARLAQYPLLHRYGAELKTYVPTLNDVLEIIEPGLELLNVEIKNDGNIYPGIEHLLLARLQASAGRLLSKILFSSFDYDTLLRVRQTDKAVRIGMLCREFDLQKALAVRAESVHMNAVRLTPQIVGACHANRLKVYAYTVNTREECARLKELGADGIFTDKIDLFVQR